jgi:hypothetical protein
MTLSALMKKGALRGTAIATPATAAIDDGKNTGTVARIATVAVANLQRSLAENREQARDIDQELLPRAWVVEEICHGGMLKAVKICSAVLEDHLWLILDRSFEPKDRTLAIYYQEELPILKTKTPEELKEIHKVKVAFPGCRVIQEGAEGQTNQRTE